MAQIINIFNFLKDYNELSNPVVTEIDKQKWSLKLSDIPEINEIWSIYRQQDFDSLKFFEVRRPILEPCPFPDGSIINWLDGDWRKLNVDVIAYKEKIIKEIINEDGTTTEIEEYFTEDKNRQNLYEKWIIKRKSWREKEIPKKQGLDLYNNLFKLYSEIKKESESVELILGDGCINWITELRNINHPVLLQNVQLEFYPDKPSFIIKCDEIKTEIYTAMLRVIPTINQAMLSEIIQDIENNPYHIANIENTKGLFQRLISILDEKGKVVEIEHSSSDGPTIMSDPILFLRKRTLGFSMFIEKIIEDIKSNEDIEIPGFFQNMIGHYKDERESEVVDENWNESGIDEDILLTLPANNEQMRIIKYLNKFGAVLVQGPPGTGKTHTIANLIGHLLSEGSSVLVTSHTEKALTVLKEKVYKDEYNKDINLQSLCISLLSTQSQKKEMDNAINEIAIKSSFLDLRESMKKIERLKKERKDLINESKVKSQELLQIRALEYKDIVYANKTIKPIEAAKFINNGYGRYDYIPGPTKDDTIGLPLSLEDISYLYHTNYQISPQEDELMCRGLPEIDTLWSIEDFDIKARNFFKYADELNDWIPNIVINDSIEESTLIEILNNAIKIKDSLNYMETYQLSIIEKTIKDRIYSTFWASIFEEIDELMINYEKYRRIQFDDSFTISADIVVEESITIIDEIINSGKEIPINVITKVIKPKWKKLHDSIFNNKKNIESRVDFEKARFIINYELQRNQLYNKINKLLNEISEKIVFNKENFEGKIIQFRERIEESLNWYDAVWMEFCNILIDICTDQDGLHKIKELDFEFPIESIKTLLENIIIPDLNKKISYELMEKLKNEWNQYEINMKIYSSYGQPFNRIIDAIVKKDVNKYKSSYEEFSEIYNKKEIHKKRWQLISKIKASAPIWADAIINRDGVHGNNKLPEDLELAWKWIQLNNQIKRIDSYDLNEVQKDLRSINDSLMENARKLAYEKAWYNKIKNKTDKQTQAIEGWRQTIKQLGKETGKTAPMLLKKARELMPLCQTAIPVWIMPLSRVVENFDPKKNKFDVVIIDEASQADILALSALYLGKKVIIVGDDEQVSPDNVGIKVDEVNAMIEQHLRGIPNNHLFNGKTSVYDMAKASGFKPLMLTEHFRCLPEIIEFSNKLSYNGRIRPLRDTSGVRTKPYVIEYRVPNGYKTDQKINELEAEHIASIICACIEQEAYTDKTMGVISLLGQNQAYEIDRLLQMNLDPNEYESRKIQCGIPPQFQGDERDIIFLSIVEGPNEKGGPVRLLREDGRNDANRKRYNVAASRAKDQMWVVHSLNPEIDLKPDDIRLKLIQHAMNPNIDKNEELLKLSESPFEKQVMEILINKGYRIIPQWKVGSYRIDMVVESGEKRVALECDGEKYHTRDDLPNDLKRQAILERLGWRFIRIRGSEFYRNPEKTMEWVFKELMQFGIKPDYSESGLNAEADNDDNNELIDNIRRRAEEIRKQWHAEEFHKTSVSLMEDPISLDDDNIDESYIDITECKNISNFKNYYLESDKAEQPDLEDIAKTTIEVLDEIKGENNKLKETVVKTIINKPKISNISKQPLFDFTKKNNSRNDKNENKGRVNVTKINKLNKQQDERKEKQNIKKPLFDFRKN